MRSLGASVLLDVQVRGLLHGTQAAGKTQIVPAISGVRVRDRASHAHEVACLAVATAVRAGLPRPVVRLVRYVGLLHDAGHPPFGHVGERVLDALARDGGGFESNAHTVHLLLGRSWVPDPVLLASVKYPGVVPELGAPTRPLVKGVYAADLPGLSGRRAEGRTVRLVRSLVEVADDLANAAFDIVDIAGYLGFDRWRAALRDVDGGLGPVGARLARCAAPDQLHRTAVQLVAGWSSDLAAARQVTEPFGRLPAEVLEQVVELRSLAAATFLRTSVSQAVDRAVGVVLTRLWAAVRAGELGRGRAGCGCAVQDRPAHAIALLSERAVLAACGADGQLLQRLARAPALGDPAGESQTTGPTTGPVHDHTTTKEHPRWRPSWPHQSSTSTPASSKPLATTSTAT